MGGREDGRRGGGRFRRVECKTVWYEEQKKRGTERKNREKDPMYMQTDQREGPHVSTTVRLHVS